MRIYISGSWTSRDRLRKERDRLWELGHTITSTWLDEQAQPVGMSHEIFMRKLAIKDVAEIVAADLLISDEGEPSTSGGRYIELGVALSRFQHIMIWVVGKGRSPFHQLADRVFETWDELAAAMKEKP